MEFFVFGSFVAFWGYAFYNTISHVTTPSSTEACQQHRRQLPDGRVGGVANRAEIQTTGAAARGGSTPGRHRASPQQQSRCHSPSKKQAFLHQAASPVRIQAQQHQSEHCTRHKRTQSPEKQRSSSQQQRTGCTNVSSPPRPIAHPVKLTPSAVPVELSDTSAIASSSQRVDFSATAARMPLDVMLLPKNESSLPQVTLPFIAQSPSYDEDSFDGFTPPPGTAVSSVLCVTPPPAPQLLRQLVEINGSPERKRQDQLVVGTHVSSQEGDNDDTSSFGLLKQLTIEATESSLQSPVLGGLSAAYSSPVEPPTPMEPANNSSPAMVPDGDCDKYSVSSYATLTQSSYIPQTPWSVFLKNSLQQRLRRPSLLRWAPKHRTESVEARAGEPAASLQVAEHRGELTAAVLRVRGANKRPRRQSVNGHRLMDLCCQCIKRRRRLSRRYRTHISTSCVPDESDSPPSHSLDDHGAGTSALDHFALLSSEVGSSFRDSGSLQDSAKGRLDSLDPIDGGCVSAVLTTRWGKESICPERKCISDLPRQLTASATRACGIAGCNCHSSVFSCITDLRKERLRLRPKTAGSARSRQGQQLSPRTRLRQWREQQRQWSRRLSPHSTRLRKPTGPPRRRSQAPRLGVPGLQHLLHDRASHRAKRSAELVEALVNLRREEEQMETTSLEMFHAWDTLVRATSTGSTGGQLSSGSATKEQTFLVEQAEKLCVAREYMDRLLAKIEGLERDNCRRFHTEQLISPAAASGDFHSAFGSIQQGVLTDFLNSSGRPKPLAAASAVVERPSEGTAISAALLTATRPATSHDVSRGAGNKAESFFLKRRLAVLQDQWEESQVGVHRLLKSIAVLEREVSVVK